LVEHMSGPFAPSSIARSAAGPKATSPSGAGQED
jgi:hypothetical protein